MKRILTFLIAASLVLSPSLVVFAGNNENVKAETTSTREIKADKSNLQKVFKQELNEKKKQLTREMGPLKEQLAQLETQYQELTAAGNTAEAEAMTSGINELKAQIQGLKSQVKQVINERFMVIKSSYTDAELSQFENASALIERMYADVNVLGLGSISVKNNLIKLDSPAYLKGGRTIIPVKAITEQLGATVTWDAGTRTVTVSKDGIEIVLTINSTKVLVNGAEQQIDAAAAITNGRTYVPLKFIAETFGLTVNWDDENDIVDIDETGTTGTEDQTPVETTVEDPAAPGTAVEDPAATGTAVEDPAATAEQPVE